MTKQLLAILVGAALMAAFAAAVLGQTSRARVSASEVNSTFRMYYSGKFKGSHNEIRIAALGGGKLKMEFALTYPYVDGTGGLMANVGEDRGTAAIAGDSAIFTSGENPECRIEIKFVRPGEIRVRHKGEVAACGYGLNVSAEGTYKKVSGKRAVFRAGS